MSIEPSDSLQLSAALPGFARRCGRRLRELLAEDRRGGVLLFFGLILVPLVGFAGLAIDSLVAFSVEARVQRALDAAGLAAGRAAREEDVVTEARAFFDANLGATGDEIAISGFDAVYSPEDESINLSVRATVPTYFMRVLGKTETTIDLQTVVNLQIRQMELVLVMDNTGSMRSGGKINAMKDAAAELVRIVFGGRESHPNLWVGLVPYVASVNIGAHRTGWLAADDPVLIGAGASPSAGKKKGKNEPAGPVDPFAPSSWKGCVMARPAPFDETDDPPTVEPFSSYLYPSGSDNNWPPLDESNAAENNGRGPNLGCGPAITSLRQSRAEVLASIEEMLPWHRGGTTGNLGLVWGWRVISPRWQGLWGGATPAELPLAYNDAESDKVVVLLTDGDNQFYDNPPSGPSGSDFTAYGRLSDFGFASLAAGRDELDRRMARTCAAMKAEGIMLYTITFGPTPNSGTQTLFRTCATSPGHYFHSPNNSDLSSVFRAIGRQLSSLRVAR
jgi:Flp pilus assembly protein TadG